MMRGQATRYSAATAEHGRAVKDALYRKRLALFAEALAEVGNVAETSRLLGLAQSTGGDYFRALRDELGDQAR